MSATETTHEPEHHPFLQHHFEDMGQQHEASTLGMWMFLSTEILFFGGLFLAYTVYRMAYEPAWVEGAHHQSLIFGTINTAVLITSSLTMALAVYYSRLGQRIATFVSLLLTLIFGSVFLIIKGIEYHAHYVEGLLPGAHFTYHSALAPKVELFMTFYFCMTGLHALHMVIGAGLLIYFMGRTWRGDFGPQYYSPVEIMGLYWHFIDIVWIYLFALLYLIGRHA